MLETLPQVYWVYCLVKQLTTFKKFQVEFNSLPQQNMAGLIYQPESLQKPILTKLVSVQTSCNEMIGCLFNWFSLLYHHHSKQATKWSHQDLYHPKMVDYVLMSMYNNHISVRNCSKSHRFPTHIFHPPDTKLIVVPSHAWSVGQSAPAQVNLIRSVSLPRGKKILVHVFYLQSRRI